MLCKVFFCLVLITSYCAHSMDVPNKENMKAARAFSLSSLKKYIISADDGLFRVVFPHEAFATTMQTIPDEINILEDFFGGEQHIISYNDLYKAIFINMHVKVTTKLVNQWLDGHKVLHEFIVENAMGPALEELSLFQNLGKIDDPTSKLRQLMTEYVEFFFGPLKTLKGSNDGYSPFDTNTYNSDDRCPSWLLNHLNNAMNLDKNMVFFITSNRLQQISEKIKQIVSGDNIHQLAIFSLGEKGFNNSIVIFSEYLLTLNQISQDEKNYSDLKNIIILSLLNTLKVVNVKAERAGEFYISDYIFSSELWKSRKIIITNVADKKANFMFSKTKHQKKTVDTEMINHIMLAILYNQEKIITDLKSSVNMVKYRKQL